MTGEVLYLNFSRVEMPGRITEFPFIRPETQRDYTEKLHTNLAKWRAICQGFPFDDTWICVSKSMTVLCKNICLYIPIAYMKYCFKLGSFVRVENTGCMIVYISSPKGKRTCQKPMRVIFKIKIHTLTTVHVGSSN